MRNSTATTVLRVAVLVAVTLAGAGCPPRVRADQTLRTDIVVIGGGAAGLAAAAQAAQDGARVILMEKTSALGGTTLRAGGGYDAAQTRWQQEANVNLPVAQLEQTVFDFGRQQGNRDLIKLFVTQSAAALDWLSGQGLKLKLANPARFPSRHTVTEGSPGVELVRVLQATLQQRGIQVLLDTTATELVTDRRRAVIGVKALTKDNRTLFVQARGTIIATGGFGASADMAAANLTAYPGIQTNLVAPSATGDGIRMAQAIGADLVQMGNAQAYPVATAKGNVLRGFEAAGAILVNNGGRRFVNELGDSNVVSQAILGQPAKTAWLVFDHAFREANQASVAAIPADLLAAGQTPEELGARAGIDGAQLKSTINSYNSYVAGRSDPEFQRPNLQVPLNRAAFHAVRVNPSIYGTLGGIAINTDAQVLRGGQPVPGLYAAGDTVGGTFGYNRAGVTGTTSAVVMGRVAAKSAQRNLR